jgi:hypothetical protein
MISPLITCNDLAAMYQRYPGALATEVASVLRPLESDKERLEHNAALSRFIVLFETEEAERHLWMNVARVIIETAMNEPVGVQINGKTK